MQNVDEKECKMDVSIREAFSNPMDIYPIEPLDIFRVFLPKYKFLIIKIPYYYEIKKLDDFVEELSTEDVKYKYRLIYSESEYTDIIVPATSLSQDVLYAIQNGISREWKKNIEAVGGGYISWEKLQLGLLRISVMKGEYRIGRKTLTWDNQFYTIPARQSGKRFLYINEDPEGKTKLIVSERESKSNKVAPIGEIEIKPNGEIDIIRGKHNWNATINLRKVSTDYLEAKIELGKSLDDVHVVKKLPERIIKKLGISQNHIWVIIYRN